MGRKKEAGGPHEPEMHSRREQQQAEPIARSLIAARLMLSGRDFVTTTKDTRAQSNSSGVFFGLTSAL